MFPLNKGLGVLFLRARVLSEAKERAIEQVYPGEKSFSLLRFFWDAKRNEGVKKHSCYSNGHVGIKMRLPCSVYRMYTLNPQAIECFSYQKVPCDDRRDGLPA